MAGLDPAIHDLALVAIKTWMPGTSPGMTRREKCERPGAIPAFFLTVIASEAKQSSFLRRDKKAGLLRRLRSSQ